MERLWTPVEKFHEQMRVLALEVNEKYPNLSLAWIPPESRGPEDSRPFAIVQVDSEGNIVAIIRRLHEIEVTPASVFNWLYENDSQRMDPWEKYKREIEAENKAREDKYREQNYALAEIFASVAKSPLHTYRFNGHKIGAENNAPTLGIFDASPANK